MATQVVNVVDTAFSDIRNTLAQQLDLPALPLQWRTLVNNFPTQKRTMGEAASNPTSKSDM